MIQILLHGLKMDPLVSLHYYAPVCALINLLVIPFTEGLAPLVDLAQGRVSPLILLSNAAVAFLLNVAAVFLVGAGSGLVLTLAGVFKDILLITGSVLIFGSVVTPLQVVGTLPRLLAPRSFFLGAHDVLRRLCHRAGRAHLVQDVGLEVRSGASVSGRSPVFGSPFAMGRVPFHSRCSMGLPSCIHHPSTLSPSHPSETLR
jgi:hypothetical protein